MKINKLLLTFIAVLFTTTVFSQNLNVTYRSHLTYPSQTLANICGYVDSLENEYALVGASGGLSIVRVTNPSSPVKVFQHTGPTGMSSKWQEIKVRGKYAYVTTEAGGGLQIFNLRSLPNVSGITMKSWTGSGAIAGQLDKIHALHIDGDYVYLYGSNLFNGGVVVADLTDPWNPVYVGKYEVGTGTGAYVHDGYVRNDTLYAGHIYSGYFSIVDFTDKANPVELVNQFTPHKFTHNTWLSADSKILFTTDEKDDTYLTSYDISDINNITELDRVQSNPDSNAVVHNTHIINVSGNDYAVTSWYKDGFTIVDAGRPQNLIQVGNYDNYAGSGGGFSGNWGVYPYLPSGTIVASNINEGMWVFTPTYLRACYLEGVVTDSVCGAQLNNVRITATAAKIKDSTDITGQYRTGTALPGTYNVTFSKSGYISKTYTGVVLSRGNVTTINVQLKPNNTVAVTGLTTDASTTNPIASVKVHIENAANSYDFTSNGSGTFSSCTVTGASDYNIYAGKWGYNTYCTSNQTINLSNNNLTYPLTKGYYDDFILDFGWTVSSSASTGMWERGVPLGTTSMSVPVNPGVDDNTDCADMAYVTGNIGVTSSDDDVDNGATTLISPVFDLSTYTDPYLDYSRWFYNGGGTGTPNDSLVIMLNNGSTTATLESVIVSSLNNSTWVPKTFRIASFIAPTSTMRLYVRTADASPGHVLEAGFDKFVITEGATEITEHNSNVPVSIYPNPFTRETTISYELKNKLHNNASIILTDITGRIVDKISLTQLNGTVILQPSINAGVYFVKILNGEELIEPVKVIKIK
ncbi:MAG: choice-of-anchor B family protein [Bacteroidota bacterium]